MPPSPSTREVTAPRQDPFFAALEGLSTRFNIAFIAEGSPFPSAKNGLLTAADADSTLEEKTPKPPRKERSLEEEVQKLAERFDYTAVRQGSLYLLTKRYTNLDDLPEVTAEECWLGLKKRGFGYRSDLVKNSAQEVLKSSGKRTFPLEPALQELASDFCVRSYGERIAATSILHENSHPTDPVLHWKTIGKSPVFGYDTQFLAREKLLFLPVSDLDRVLVTPAGTPAPRPDYTLRTEFTVPSPDPTDPATLSDQTKRFLDDNGKSSRAITLTEAIAALNARAVKKGMYRVDTPYAGKHVTLVGVDKLPPETVMQTLAALYNLRIVQKDGISLLTDPQQILARVHPHEVFRHEYGHIVGSMMPAPIYRAMHARFLAGRTKTKDQEGPEILEFKDQYEYQRMATAYRNSAIRMFRYLAEPQVKAQPDAKLALSRLGERARNLLAFAQTASAYAAYCELADISLPPYITDIDDFRQNVKISGGPYQGKDGSMWYALSLTYVDPNSGVGHGPVRFFDAPMNL